MLNRKVMMGDGIVRDQHQVVTITHLIGIRTTIDILSTTSVNEDDEETYPMTWRHIVTPYDTTITESDAYDIISNLC